MPNPLLMRALFSKNSSGYPFFHSPSILFPVLHLIRPVPWGFPYEFTAPVYHPDSPLGAMYGIRDTSGDGQFSTNDDA